MGAYEKKAAHTDYWLQKWIAAAESIGISKRALLEDYYFDEFLAVLDAYNEMHNPDRKPEAVEVAADAW